MNYLVLAALVPAVVLMYIVYKKDKVEKEPAGLILKLALAGGATVVSAIILELIGGHILTEFLELDETTMIYNFFETFIVVAGTEELGKLVALRLCTWKSKEFNYTYDAVVYAVASSLGFAAVENVLYVVTTGLGTAILRALTAVPGHCIFGVYMGCYYGISRQAWGQGRKAKEKLNAALAYIVPVLLHGFYDFCLFEHAPDYFTFIFLFAYGLMFIFAVRKISILSKDDIPIMGSGMDFPENMAPAAPINAQIQGSLPQYGNMGTQAQMPQYQPMTGQNRIPPYQPMNGQQNTIPPYQPMNGQQNPIPPYQPMNGQQNPIPPYQPMNGQQNTVPPYQPMNGQQNTIPPYQPMNGQQNTIPPYQPMNGQQNTVPPYQSMNGQQQAASPYPPANNQQAPAPSERSVPTYDYYKR